MLTFEPSDLVRAAGRLSELVFTHEYGKVPWLLVRIARGEDELAAALRAADASLATVRPPGQIAFHTEAVSAALLGVGRAAAHATEVGWSSFMRTLGSEQYHVLPVQKRTDVDAVFGERISIGRALNKDIVFRHASISKFHAYFVRGAPDSCTVTDAGSKNGTLVNGVRIRPRESVEIVSGDQVTFGSIATIVVDARTLFRALRTR